MGIIKNKINKILVATSLVFGLASCVGDSADSPPAPVPPVGQTCGVTGNQALDVAVNNYGNVIDSVATLNEFTARTGSFDRVYNVGQFLKDFDFQRQIGVTELPPTAVEGTQLNGGYTSAFISSEEDKSGLSGSALEELVGFAVALDFAKTKKVNNKTFVQFEIQFEDVVFRQVNNTQEVIENNIVQSPNANQFVYGVYEAKITNKLTIKDECNEEINVNSTTDIAFFSSKIDNATTTKGSADNEIIITSDVQVPVGYLIRGITPTIITPHNINAVVSEGPNISLKWDLIAPSYNYRVYYSANSNFETGDDNVEIVDVQLPEFSLQQGLSRGQTLYFQITSLAGGSESEPSARVSVTIPVDTPESALVLSASARGDGTVRLQWGSPIENDAIEYTIFRKKIGTSNFIELTTVRPNTNAFIKREIIDSNVELATTYVYQLTYSNFLSPPASPLSTEVAATTIDVVIADNLPPVAVAGTAISASYGDTVTLDGGASTDDNNEITSYLWEPSPGNPASVNILNNNQPQATFVAPISAEELLQLSFVLTVSDGVSQDSDTVNVILTPQPTPGGGNQPPEAVIVASTEEPKVGETVTLNAGSSTDSDNDTLSYKWSQIDSNADLGINDLTDAQIAFEIPTGTVAGTVFNLLLEASDGFAADTAVANITVIEDPIIQGDLEVYIETSHNPVGQNEEVMVVITVANNSGADKTGVVLTMDYPEGFNGLSRSYISEGGVCGSSVCDPGDNITWTLGTLPAGASTFVILSPIAVSDIANGADIPINVSVIDQSEVMTTASYNLKGINKRELNLQLVEASNPVVGGNSLTYKLAYGFSATSAVADEVILTFVLPENISFSSASHGGNVTQGVVNWTLGRLEPGEIGFVNVELQILNNTPVGTIILAQANIVDNGNRVTIAETYTRVEQAQGLNLVMSVYPESVQANEQMYITLTASNTSNIDHENMNIFFRYAQELQDLATDFISDGGACISGRCDTDGETTEWSLGTVKANSATTVTLTPHLHNMSAGSVLKLYAELEQSNSTLVAAKGRQSISIIDDRQLELAIDVDHNPVTPGEQLTYALNYSLNATSVISEGTILSLTLPENTSFVSASNGGTLAGNKVSWPLTRLDPGESGQVKLVVQVGNSVVAGSTLVANAQLIDNQTPNPRLTTSKVVTQVEAERPLELTMATSRNPVRSAEQLTVELIINNTSDFKRSGISVNMRYPSEFKNMDYDYFVSDSGFCPNSLCDENGEFLIWNIGDIEANSTKTLTLTPWIHENVQQGNMIELYAELEQGEDYSVEATDSLTIKNDRFIELVTTEDRDPVMPGEFLIYTLTYSAYSPGSSLASAVLETTLPAGVEYVDASNGGIFADNKVVWILGSIAAGQSGKRTLTVKVIDTLVAGSTLKLDSIFKEVGADPEVVSRSDIVTRVEEARPLELAITATPAAIGPGTAMSVSLTVNNTADFERSAIWIALHFPTEWDRLDSSLISDDGFCVIRSSYCEQDGELIWWNIGSLPANDSKVVTLQPTVFDTIAKGMLLELNAKTFDSSGTTTREHKVIAIE
jgi:hypothetical protein